jgi:hypothetical protein
VTRAFDFVVVGVIWLIAIIVHRISVELFAPESPLHAMASDGTAAMNGAARADLWFEILSVWVPILVCGGILAWALLREYRRSTATAVRQRRP